LESSCVQIKATGLVSKALSPDSRVKRVNRWRKLKPRAIFLEQSGVPPSAVTLTRKAILEELGQGWMRLNWNPEAVGRDFPETIDGRGMTWAEGRNKLAHEALKLDYEYLVFLDDDIRLSKPVGSSWAQLRDESTESAWI